MASRSPLRALFPALRGGRGRGSRAGKRKKTIAVGVGLGAGALVLALWPKKASASEPAQRSLTPGNSGGGGGGSGGHVSVQRGESDAVKAILARYGSKVSTAQALSIARAALAVGTDPVWLAELIDHESAHTFSPVVVNSGTKATGIIQFMPTTAADLFGWKMEGTCKTEEGARYPCYTQAQKDAAQGVLLGMSFDDQVALAIRYLKMQGRVTKGLDTRQKLAMSVFYPKAASWHPDAEFPPKVQAANKLRTVRDYLSRVYGPTAAAAA